MAATAPLQAMEEWDSTIAGFSFALLTACSSLYPITDIFIDSPSP